MQRSSRSGEAGGTRVSTLLTDAKEPERGDHHRGAGGPAMGWMMVGEE